RPGGLPVWSDDFRRRRRNRDTLGSARDRARMAATSRVRQAGERPHYGTRTPVGRIATSRSIFKPQPSRKDSFAFVQANHASPTQEVLAPIRSKAARTSVTQSNAVQRAF